MIDYTRFEVHPVMAHEKLMEFFERDAASAGR